MPQHNLLETLQEGLERAKAFIRADTTKKIEDITGYPLRLLEKMLVVRKERGLVLLNYSDATPHILGDEKLPWTPFLRVCRGLVLSEDGALVSFPFHKFFNLNEKEETHEKEVAKWTIRTITEKLDGVMIQIFRWNDELFYASRHGIWSRASVTALKLAPPPVITPIIEAIPFPKWTLICELIHPEHRTPGMIDYGDVQALALLAVRNLETLELYNATEIFSDVPSPFLLPTTYSGSFWSLRDFIRNYPKFDFEGVVLQGVEGLGNQLVKMKTSAYIERLRTIRNLTPKRVLEFYEKAGWEGINSLLGGVEELVDDEILQLKATIQETERKMEAYLRELREKEIHEIPQIYRWVKNYEWGSPKWSSAFRKCVVNTIIQQTTKDKK